MSDENSMLSFPGDQEEFEGAPQEFKDHMIKAFAHMAGHGPHPGKYSGPPYKRKDAEQDDDEITDVDMQHAREEPLDEERPHEASYKKMKAAKSGGATAGLGPTQIQQQQAKQTGTLQQAAAAQGQMQAAQKQAAMIPQGSGPGQAVAPPPAAPGGEEQQQEEG